MFILENFKDIERMITSPTIPSPQSNCHVFGLYSSVLLLSFSHPRWAHILVIQYSTYHFNVNPPHSTRVLESLKESTISTAIGR